MDHFSEVGITHKWSLLKNYSFLDRKISLELLFLKFTFWVSLLGILLSIIFTHIFGRPVLVYYVVYVLFLGMVVSLFVPKFSINLSGVSRNVFTLLVYSLLITLPLTIIYNHVTAFFVFYKNFLMLVILFLYYLKKLRNLQQLTDFLKGIIKGGIFFAGYICFEFVNKFFNLFPFFNQIISEYFVANKNDAIGNYMNPEGFDIYSVIRPLGLELSFTASGYFLASIFFILVIAGKRFISNKYWRIPLVFLLYISVIVTTSRQNIFAMHFLLAFLLLIVMIKKNKLDKIKFKSIRQHIFYVLIAIGVVAAALILSNISMYLEYLTETNGGTGSILTRDLEELPANLANIFLHHPINGFLGIGGYSSSLPGIYFELPPINELHFLLDIFYAMGIVGFIIFWSIFITSVWTCWRAFLISNSRSSEYKDLYLSGVFIGLLFIINIVHYAPMGLSNTFIIAFIPLLSVFARKEIVMSRIH
jgi:hypothetical protein